MARKKKLKKIPYDLVSYIQIETETIEDADDKMMIASYCLGKLQCPLPAKIDRKKVKKTE